MGQGDSKSKKEGVTRRDERGRGHQVGVGVFEVDDPDGSHREGFRVLSL